MAQNGLLALWVREHLGRGVTLFEPQQFPLAERVVDDTRFLSGPNNTVVSLGICATIFSALLDVTM
jgi:hypothetical protein